MPGTTAIPLPAEALAEFCRRWNIVRLEVFGSILREDFGPASDVDFLVTWAPGIPRRFVDHEAAREELSNLLRRPVDLISREAVELSSNPLRRKCILGSAETVYVAA